MNKDEKSKIVSDSELSLISAISGLDNKLEELDHNLAMMTKSGKEFSMPNINENEMNKKILDLEEKLTVLDQKISEKNLIPKLVSFCLFSLNTIFLLSFIILGFSTCVFI